MDARSTYLNTFDDVAAGPRGGAGDDPRWASTCSITTPIAAALGLFQAVKESPGAFIFGANADQSALAPERVLGSAVIDLPRAFLAVAREVKAGGFSPEGRIVRTEERRDALRAQSCARGRGSRRALRPALKAAADSIIARGDRGRRR